MNKKVPIGIMQGRLSPRHRGLYQAFPEQTWKAEFQVARDLGFDCIEFIFDYENHERNPLFSREGRQEIRECVASSGVRVHSICADYFMNAPFFIQDQDQRKRSIGMLLDLFNNAAQLGIRDVTVPCVDQSSLKSEEELQMFQDSLHEVLPAADSSGVNINLETDLPPLRFASLVEALNHPRLKINYDIGNSASWGYDPTAELDAYGSHISVLHVKDRLYRGGSVELGTGNANFETVFKKFGKMNFGGLIVMQAARAERASDEIEYVRKQFAFLKDCLQRWWE